MNYPRIDIPVMYPEEVYKKLDSLVILDIGGPELHKIGSISQGSVIHIALDDLEDKYEELPKDKLLVITDVAGKQENIAGRFLTMKGFTKLAAMGGGGRAWFKMIRVKEMMHQKKEPRKKE
ncbi:hypothetical protein DGMP_05410 [Desulfomarina profundi]|uniref:Rhodanese domain-containing protein n=1 Tax=Desulfomarina profundi TaxID=2772557 RepID=A0A8D5FEJ2_9BACT|nr:rhodanese-like domain-containing protein [Desulfomarina profundi]BCL59848.1 hypothetical protein DGMP_05410 [Desulfomarina profundi]